MPPEKADKAPRPSNTGAGGYKPRTSNAAWGPGGGQPRASVTGGVRRSYRGSKRGSNRSGMEGGGGAPQVVDEDGIDRTPKPLMALRSRDAKGAPGLQDDTGTPNSEASEFFMDRLSSANFSRTGWYSETNSGTATPKSETDDEYDYAAQKEKEKKLAEDMEKAAQEEAAAEREARKAKRKEEEYEGGPDMLSEKDLEKQVYLQLCETETIFILSIPCVTVAGDSEEAKVVEEGNKRYATLLMTKQAADRYTDVDTQTFNLMKKTREVQTSVMALHTVGCQATTWDISDTYLRMDEAAAEAEDEKAGNLPSLNQLTGGVARGDAYAAAGHGASNNQSRRTTMMGGMGNAPERSMSMMSHMAASFSGRPGGQSASWMNRGTAYGAVQGMMPSQDGTGVPGSADGGADGDIGPPPDPLFELPGLLEALRTMDAAVAQNMYLDRLLLYRNINSGAIMAAPNAAASSSQGPDLEQEEPPAVRSAAPSRPMSRAGSVAGSNTGDGHRSTHSHASHVSHALSHIQRDDDARSRTGDDNRSRAGDDNRSQKAGGGPASVKDMPVGPGANYAPSQAESHWPEELLQDLADLGPDGVPRMDPLWEWSCPLTEKQTVACMAWNKARPDLLAVGYGNYSFGKDADHSVATKGLVAFWSLKNPQYPLWYFETRSGVTALDFATQNPNILAVGLYDGTVAIYDVKSQHGTPSMESDANTGRHSDPVWKVRWLDRGPEREEALVSISTDGRVTQWSIAKGLEFADLMKLKRVPRRGQGLGLSNHKPNAAASASAEQDAFISRLTSGMAFDFSQRDERIYIAGTEDGWIHRCSTSYSEQYLESYQGHMGPVYQVQWSPFQKNMFISCSGDWTIRLWQEGRDTALLTFQSSNQEVNDVQWCPTNSTVFGSVTSGGRLEIWDFDLSTVKPVVTHKANMKLSCLLFSPTSPVVVCGGENGSVMVFRLFNVDKEYDTLDEQLDRLEEVIRQNVMKTSGI